jgi:two-component system, NtrC family, nitrogen regulation sensor histidine kinase NtrY
VNPSLTIKSFLYKNAYLLILAAWLFTFSFLFQYYWSYTSAPAQVRKTIERSIKTRHADFEQLLADVQLTERLFNFKAGKEEFNTVSGKDYFIFLAQYTADGPELKFWNTQIIQPTNSLWYHEDGQWFQKLINGYYVVVRKTIQVEKNKKVAALALIPVKWDYFITTNDLNNSFAYLNAIEDYYDLSNTTVTELPVRNQQNEILFYLTQKVNTPQPLSLFTIFLRLSAMLCVLWFIHRAAVQIAVQKNFAAGFSFLVVFLIGARVLSYYKPFPVNFRQFELFDPSVYGSDIILKSLGDFLINVLLLLWLLLFANTNSKNFFQFKISRGRYVVAFFIAAIMYLLTLYFGNAVRSLVADSQISFDVTNFFSLSAYSFVGFFILGCLSVCCYLLFRWLLQLVQLQSRQQLLAQLVMIIVAGFIYLTITINSGRVPFHLGLLAWLVLFVSLYRLQIRLFSFVPQGAYSLFWLLFFSVSLTVLLLTENSTKEWADRKRMAEKLSLQTDPSAENLLSIALNNFRADFLQENFSRFRTQGGNQYLKDSLLGEHFSGYLNKFETKIFTYTADEQSLFNDDSTSFSTLNTIYNLQSKILNNADWRYYEESFDKFYYLARREVTDIATFKTKGYVFVLSKPRRYSGEKFYPELFSKTFNLQTDFTPAYAYAIYKNDELVNSYNDYPFAIHLPPHHTTPSGFHEHAVDGFSELWYNATPSRAVVVVKRKDGWLQAITLFAYLFLVFLMMFVLFRVLQTVSQNKLSLKKWKQTAQFNFRTQVHTTITAISVFSFFVIGVSTIFFFINRHSRSNKERLSRTIQIMRSEVEQALQQQSIMDDMIKVYDDVNAGDLQLKVNRISEIHGVDVNVYDPSGSLRVSSQPYYYNKGLLSRRMEPHAYFRLSKDMLVQTIDFEKVGSRSYMSIYVPVRDEKGTPYAFLNIPYFTSQNELRQEISSFLVTLINLNAFIFLVAGIIAFFVTNRITSSFTFISNKMKEIKLGKANEAILWNRSDEIGELVAEYNKMVLQLEASAALLAKSEREGAWREMARQVAHEIKNPLTPMKLSIQYLQKAVDNNAADTRELSKSVAKTLVEQIDYLSTIASDFSNFANIGTAKLQRINLQQSLQSVIDLFGMNAESEIVFEAAPSQTLFVMGDKTQMNRLFTNLIRNAIESVPAERKPYVQVTVQPDASFITVVIKDNGDGIEPDLRDKIFYPNFTTKTSGTGLGLAMCKGIVEQMKGDIWFETETGKGTTFFVKMERVG